jgi:hypothetical protein
MPGKQDELRAFANRIAVYVKEKCNFDLGLSTPVAGDPNRVAFYSMTQSLAEFEAVGRKLAADAEYQQLIATMATTVIPGLAHDDLWSNA